MLEEKKGNHFNSSSLESVSLPTHFSEDKTCLYNFLTCFTIRIVWSWTHLPLQHWTFQPTFWVFVIWIEVKNPTLRYFFPTFILTTCSRMRLCVSFHNFFFGNFLFNESFITYLFELILLAELWNWNVIVFIVLSFKWLKSLCYKISMYLSKDIEVRLVIIQKWWKCDSEKTPIYWNCAYVYVLTGALDK